ncbi:hypothetical protein PsYK624_077110 [Phanerochaete sordida]|uniref:Glucose-methanol-choline oxidoreductase C-terminal domain-containing protein n=1 Tax=Phanerochaete sordida TaxID=48140 RepID=A0A9P3GB66_9APHY|nr:hypothetical protein PsYK624_077110 [Phanerochaete sordida]
MEQADDHHDVAHRGLGAMLPRDANGVVDPALRVYGTRNLRAVDIPVALLYFALHTQGVVYAVAEKAADMIEDEQVEKL